jgi:hypothetical protein
MRGVYYAVATLPSVVLMAYGLYLWELRQSFSDIAGIIMISIGACGLAFSIITRLFLQVWQNWYASLLIGVVSCVAVFASLVVLVRFG